MRDDQQIEKLVQLARQARKYSLHQYRDVIIPQYIIFFEAEQFADSMLIYEAMVIPGILQTRDYAKALFTLLCDYPEDKTERSVDFRMHRQHVLNRDEPPTIHAIMDENVFRRQIGDDRVWGNQIDLLCEMNKRDNITLEVIPFSSGIYPLRGYSFVILDFDDADSIIHFDHVYLGVTSPSESEAVNKFRDYFHKFSQLTVPFSDFIREL